MEENRRNSKEEKHWTDTKTRMQNVCDRAGGVPSRGPINSNIGKRAWVNNGALEEVQRSGCKLKDQRQP